MRIAIAGGSGFIGARLAETIAAAGDEPILISRFDDTAGSRGWRTWTWEQLEQPDSARHLAQDKLDAVVNLAGETINQRWTDAAKARIRNSRLESTRSLFRWLQTLDSPPPVVVQGSAIGYYGTSLTEEFDESSGPGVAGDFLSSVTADWEREAERHCPSGMRLVKLRTGLVLDGKQGALPRMLLPYRLGAGGPIGIGNQIYSWIHIDDLVGLIRTAIGNAAIDGPLNGTAPNPVTNDSFGRVIGSVLKRPHWMPVPSFAMKLALGEMSELVLQGQRVLPAAALRHGYRFRYPQLEDALRQLLRG